MVKIAQKKPNFDWFLLIDRMKEGGHRQRVALRGATRRNKKHLTAATISS